MNIPSARPCRFDLIELFWPVDGGTAWMARDSVMIETDDVDFSGGVNAPWWFLTQQLKHDLASIILMSEEDLQVV